MRTPCLVIAGLLLMLPYAITAQEKQEDRKLLDDQFIYNFENEKEPYKVLHAEPLYIDLIRDLGARKGEHEWNIGFGLLDRSAYEEYEFLIEYEFALIDRLGLEIELPFSFFSATDRSTAVPGNQLDGLQLAAQYTFMVSKKTKVSLALGYLHKFKLASFDQYGQNPVYIGNIYNPFFIAAKRWGRSFHTLVYTGPEFDRPFNSGTTQMAFEINSNVHYMIPGTSNFVGIEFNKSIEEGECSMTIRPQIRVEIRDDLLIGLVTGIPAERLDEKLSMFVRLIYEPD